MLQKFLLNVASCPQKDKKDEVRDEDSQTEPDTTNYITAYSKPNPTSTSNPTSITNPIHRQITKPLITIPSPHH